MRLYGPLPNIVTFNTAIAVMDKGHMWKRALHFFDEITPARLRPDTITFNSIISACEKGVPWEVTMTFLSEMRSNELVPNENTYTSAVNTCSKARAWENAINFFNEMVGERVDIDESVFNSLTVACGGAFRWSQSIVLVEDMANQSLQLNMVALGGCLRSCENAAVPRRHPAVFFPKMRRAVRDLLGFGNSKGVGMTNEVRRVTSLEWSLNTLISVESAFASEHPLLPRRAFAVPERELSEILQIKASSAQCVTASLGDKFCDADGLGRSRTRHALAAIGLRRESFPNLENPLKDIKETRI